MSRPKGSHGGLRPGAGRPRKTTPPERRGQVMLPLAVVERAREAARAAGLSIGKWVAAAITAALEKEDVQ